MWMYLQIPDACQLSSATIVHRPLPLRLRREYSVARWPSRREKVQGLRRFEFPWVDR